MRQPVTELDTRFSDQDAVATDWEETRRALEDAELFWISTVRADGRPHVTPLVAVWLDDAICFATGPGEQKAVNLRTNQNVILTTGCNEWERGLELVEGEAVQVMDENVLVRLAETWVTKWDGRWRYEVHEGGFRHGGGGDAVLVFSVKPAKVLAFAKGTFGQTRDRFWYLRAALDVSLLKGGSRVARSRPAREGPGLDGAMAASKGERKPDRRRCSASTTYLARRCSVFSGPFVQARTSLSL